MVTANLINAFKELVDIGYNDDDTEEVIIVEDKWP